MKIECQVLKGISQKSGKEYIYIYIPLLEKRIFEISDLEKKVLESAMATKGDK